MSQRAPAAMLKRILIPEIVREPGDQAVRSQGWSEGSEGQWSREASRVMGDTGEPRGANYADYPETSSLVTIFIAIIIPL